MNERDFYYWLQGFFELSGATELTAKQVKMIKEHMALVTEKVTQTSVDEETQSDDKKLLLDGVQDPLPQKWPNHQAGSTRCCSTTADTICHSTQFLTC